MNTKRLAGHPAGERLSRLAFEVRLKDDDERAGLPRSHGLTSHTTHDPGRLGLSFTHIFQIVFALEGSRKVARP